MSRLIYPLSKKSQAWGIDLIIGLMIFSIGILVFFVYTMNDPSEASDTFEVLNYEGNNIMKTLLSEGYPVDWNTTNVVKVGLSSGNKLNQTKLEYFYNLSYENYTLIKSLFNTNYDFYFFLDTNITINGSEIRGIGKPGTDPEDIQALNLKRITRLTIYDNQPKTAYLYIWN